MAVGSQSQISQLKLTFDKLNSEQKRVFTANLRKQLQGSANPEYLRFLNYCVQQSERINNTPERINNIPSIAYDIPGIVIDENDITNNVYEEYENTVSEYIRKGYKLVNQSDNHSELKKGGILRFLFWLLIFPNIISLIGYGMGDYSGSAANRFDQATLENAAKLQNGYLFAGIALVIGICVLIAGRGKNKVFIRITKTGKLDITGYDLKKSKASQISTIIIIGSIVLIIVVGIIIGSLIMNSTIRSLTPYL